MRTFWIAASAAVLALSAIPGLAAKTTIALVPTHTFKGAAGNDKVITDALRRSLEKHGFEVLPAGKVDSALKSDNINLSQIQNIKTLGPVRTSTGADYLVYPRALSVGLALEGKGALQANILVNVIGKSTSSFVHTRQVGQEFKSENRNPDTTVITAEAADAAAEKLLEPFYAKVK